MAEKITVDELRQKRLTALKEVQFGAVYRHEKSGKYYTPKEVALDEEDLEPRIVYSPLTAADVVFVRQLEEWLGKFVKVPHDPKKPNFGMGSSSFRP